VRRRPRRLTAEQQREIWDRLARGERAQSIGPAVGCHHNTVRELVAHSGGIRPRERKRAARSLSVAEREEISRGLAQGESMRSIAARLGRAPSTVSREVAHNGGPRGYRALAADRQAWALAERPKPAKLATCPKLRHIVERKLERHWSPRQISRWLARTFPGDPELQVSHETIYLSLFVQGRGALRKELHQALRTGRAMRRPKAKSPMKRRSHIPNMVLISERPAEVNDRAVPGHWEGDLILGAKRTCIGTLVERSTRYVLLLRLPDGTAESVRKAMTRSIRTLPRELVRSVTWDQGNEMAHHERFTVDTGVQVYFCDPKSPWQRGSNENTNGLLRQYFPKGTDLSIHTQRELNAVARELNDRPRETLGWDSPLERLREVVASTH
jgi:IS30 family transposase